MWRGGDGRENVQKTLEDAHVFAQMNFYNKHIFFWKHLNQYVSFGGRFVADSKCVEGMQATGGPTSKYYCPQTKMSFPELANPHRLLFDSNNKVKTVDSRDYILQEIEGSKYEVVKAAYDLVVTARKAGLMSPPAYMNYKIIERLKEIVQTNFSVYTLKEGQDRICKMLDAAKDEAIDCILMKKREIAIFDDRIAFLYAQSMTPSSSSSSATTTCSRSSAQDPYRKVVVPMLKSLLKERNIVFKGKTLRKDLVKLLVDADDKENMIRDSCSSTESTEFSTSDEQEVIEENGNSNVVREKITTNMVRGKHNRV